MYAHIQYRINGAGLIQWSNYGMTQHLNVLFLTSTWNQVIIFISIHMYVYLCTYVHIQMDLYIHIYTYIYTSYTETYWVFKNHEYFYYKHDVSQFLPCIIAVSANVIFYLYLTRNKVYLILFHIGDILVTKHYVYCMRYIIQLQLWKHKMFDKHIQSRVRSMSLRVLSNDLWSLWEKLIRREVYVHSQDWWLIASLGVANKKGCYI